MYTSVNENVEIMIVLDSGERLRSYKDSVFRVVIYHAHKVEHDANEVVRVFEGTKAQCIRYGRRYYDKVIPSKWFREAYQAAVSCPWVE